MVRIHPLGEGTRDEYSPNMAGGSRGASQNSADSDDLGRFAVDEHNKKQKSLSAQFDVLCDTLLHLTIEDIEADKNVWVKPWMDFKPLRELRDVGYAPNITNSDLGAWRGDHPSEWQDVAVNDPEVQNAAVYALERIQEQCDAIELFELEEVVDAKAEGGKESAKFNMALKVKWGSDTGKFIVEVYNLGDGHFELGEFIS